MWHKISVYMFHSISTFATVCTSCIKISISTQALSSDICRINTGCRYQNSNNSTMSTFVISCLDICEISWDIVWSLDIQNLATNICRKHKKVWMNFCTYNFWRIFITGKGIMRTIKMVYIPSFEICLRYVGCNNREGYKWNRELASNCNKTKLWKIIA